MLTSPSEIFKKAHELKEQKESFVLATVVAVRGATSAKTGSKAIFNSSAKNVLGWVGGGCAESFLARQSQEVLELKTPRVVTVDLDDEVFGLMPCGGVMDVYLEPHFLAPKIQISNFLDWHEPISQFLAQLGFEVEKVELSNEIKIKNWRECFLFVADILSRQSGQNLSSLRDTKGEIHSKTEPLAIGNAKIFLLGQTRITEELCRMARLLDWQVDLYAQNPSHDETPIGINVCELPFSFKSVSIPKGAWVIVASHHQQDHEFVAHALRSGAEYVALVASQKRSHLILADLKKKELPQGSLKAFFAPAGLNFSTETPTQIAFSMISEILHLQAKQ